MKPRQSSPARDQAPSSFSEKLEHFCRISGVRSATLVDSEGETVDYAGCREPFELRLGAAECRLLLSQLQLCRGDLASTLQVRLRARRRSFLIAGLTEGYAVVIELPRRAFDVSPRALATLLRDLADDAGLPEPAQPPYGSWAPVRVRPVPGKRRRPGWLGLGAAWLQVEVLGSLAEPPLVPGEQGFRVRLPHGAEATLVREPGGRWFAEPENLFNA